MRAKYGSAGELLASYRPPGRTSFLHGGLFFATREPVPMGDTVLVEIRLPELADKLILRGVVVWRNGAGAGDSGDIVSPLGRKGGVAVELHASERTKRDFLVALARGEVSQPLRARNHRRLPVELRVDWRVKEERERSSGTLDDIGPGGAFMRTRAFHPTGTSLVLEVVPPGAAAPLSIEARVAWARQSPGTEGLGLEFRCRDTGGLRRLKELVRRLELLPTA